MAGDLTGPLRSLVRALFRMNRPTTDGIGRMSSVLYFLRSESEQPLTMRVGKRTTMPVGSRTGHRQNEPVLTCSHPEARAHGGIPAFSHRPVEPPNIRSTRHSPRTREMRPVLPVRAGFASSLQPVFPSFHAHRDRPPAESRFRQGRTDTDEIFIVWARSIHPPQDMPGKRSS